MFQISDSVEISRASKSAQVETIFSSPSRPPVHVIGGGKFLEDVAPVSYTHLTLPTNREV